MRDGEDLSASPLAGRVHVFRNGSNFTDTIVEKSYDQTGYSLRDLLHVVFKRRRLIALFFIATTLTVTAGTFLLVKPVYQATAQMLVSPGREHIADLTLPTGGAIPPRLSYNAEEQISRTIEMLTGRFLAQHVVQSIGPTVLYKNLERDALRSLNMFWREPPEKPVLLEIAVGRVMDNVSAESVGKSSLVNVSFKHEDPAMAAKVVNLLGELYLERHLGVQKNPRTDAFFEEQIQVRKRSLHDAEERLEAFKKSNNIAHSVKDEQDINLVQELSLQGALNETRSRQAEIESRMNQLRHQLANTSRNPSAAKAIQEKLATLEIQEGELALRLAAENPTLRRVREEIALLREKLVALEATGKYGTASSSDGSLHSRLQEELLRSEAEQKALRARGDSQAVQLGERQQRLERLKRISMDFDHLQQQVQLEEQSYRPYLTKLEDLRISTAMDAERIASVRVIEPAQSPMSPLNSKVSLKILLGLFFGCFGGLGLALLLHFISGRFETIGDIENYLELPVLASIPELDLR
jgi:uncharacterized protein involved in exopolysaccharide biosynthesis